MGLDQYAFARAETTTPREEWTELAYWRKHNRLQGWMEDLWNSRGKPDKNEEDDFFNCIPLPLTTADLDVLEVTLREKALPKTEGFFFGEDSYSRPDLIKEDLRFIVAARAALDQGLEVFYYCWW